jgi:hypothetical protein
MSTQGALPLEPHQKLFCKKVFGFQKTQNKCFLKVLEERGGGGEKLLSRPPAAGL